MLASGIQVINGGKIQGDLYERPKNHKKKSLTYEAGSWCLNLLF